LKSKFQTVAEKTAKNFRRATLFCRTWYAGESDFKVMGTDFDDDAGLPGVNSPPRRRLSDTYIGVIVGILAVVILLIIVVSVVVAVRLRRKKYTGGGSSASPSKFVFTSTALRHSTDVDYAQTLPLAAVR